jgi:hypothetical protein
MTECTLGVTDGTGAYDVDVPVRLADVLVDAEQNWYPSKIASLFASQSDDDVVRIPS